MKKKLQNIMLEGLEEWISNNVSKETTLKEDFDKWYKEKDLDLLLKEKRKLFREWCMKANFCNEMMRQKGEAENGLYWLEELVLGYDSLGLSFNNTIKIREDCFDDTHSLLNKEKLKYNKISENAFTVVCLGYTFSFIKE